MGCHFLLACLLPTAAALTRAGHAAAALARAGQGCWDECGERGGICDWCGRGGVCCRRDWQDDPPECSASSMWGKRSGHVCGMAALPPADAFGQRQGAQRPLRDTAEVAKAATTRARAAGDCPYLRSRDVPLTLALSGPGEAKEATREHTLSQVPRIIWTYWGDGLAAAPCVVRLCVGNWERMHRHGSWDVRVLDNTTAPQYCPALQQGRAKGERGADVRAALARMPAYKWADYVRLCVLERHGGVWIDASIFLTRSLEWVLPLQQRKRATWLGYAWPGTAVAGHAPLIENWWMASPPRQPFVRAWRKEFERSLVLGVDNYIASIRQSGIETVISRFEDSGVGVLPEYHTAHVAAQKLFLTSKSAPYFRLCVMRSDNDNDGPYFLQRTAEWDDGNLIRILTGANGSAMLPTHARMVKLNGPERNALERWLRAHLSEPPAPTSIYAKFLLGRNTSLSITCARA